MDGAGQRDLESVRAGDDPVGRWMSSAGNSAVAIAEQRGLPIPVDVKWREER